MTYKYTVTFKHEDLTECCEFNITSFDHAEEFFKKILKEAAPKLGSWELTLIRNEDNKTLFSCIKSY